MSSSIHPTSFAQWVGVGASLVLGIVHSYEQADVGPALMELSL